MLYRSEPDDARVEVYRRARNPIKHRTNHPYRIHSAYLVYPRELLISTPRLSLMHFGIQQPIICKDGDPAKSYICCRISIPRTDDGEVYVQEPAHFRMHINGG